MKRKRRVNPYSVFVTFLFLLFFGLFLFDLYMTDQMSDAYDELLEVTNEQSDRYESLNDDWQKSYSDLETQYGHLLVQNDQLREELGYCIDSHVLSADEMELLAKVAQTEAGCFYNHQQSQIYVVNVIINRVRSSDFPDSVEEVVYQKVNGVPQFSVAYDGSLDSCDLEESTMENIKKAFRSESFGLPEYVQYFYSSSVTEKWVNTLDIYTVCEGTVFAYEED